jgi:glutamate dehydrogenase (NADP+)
MVAWTLPGETDKRRADGRYLSRLPSHTPWSTPQSLNSNKSVSPPLTYRPSFTLFL